VLNFKPAISISTQEWQIVSHILNEILPSREVWAFGSRVNKNHKPFSDLDLVVAGNQALSLVEMADLSEAFSHSNLPYRVDVVDWATTETSFKEIIESNFVVLKESTDFNPAQTQPPAP
jgi:predicted nucleotidyltransferase